MGLREEKKEHLRTQIYESAIAAFRSRGFDAVRVHEIVGELSISEPTFYNYFPTKEAVLDEYALRAVEDFHTLLAALSGRHPREPITTTISELMDTLAAVFARDTEFMAVVVIRSRLFWGASGALSERELHTYELLTALFADAQSVGELRPELSPRRLAESLTGAYMLAVANWLIGWWPEHPPLADILREVGDTLLRGALRPSGSRGTRHRPLG
ncbi:MAG TPA: TetR/AcrR family transcriptional regulator [Acidimicrobiales bacterium]|nr:TetR/AcrR family transcriptional regulator [Acidimicrobiales bacterium]